MFPGTGFCAQLNRLGKNLISLFFLRYKFIKKELKKVLRHQGIKKLLLTAGNLD